VWDIFYLPEKLSEKSSENHPKKIKTSQMYSVGMKKSKNMLKKFKICVDKKRQT
jgi:hypothetical protein